MRWSSYALGVVAAMATADVTSVLAEENSSVKQFEAEYERPFWDVVPIPDATDQPYTNGVKTYSFNVDGSGMGWGGSRGISISSCLTPALRFCVREADMNLAIPRGPLREGATWASADVDFRVLSKGHVRFRGNMIETYLIQGYLRKAFVATLYSYNEDIGVIAYAPVGTELIKPHEVRMPAAVAFYAVLSSPEGVGGKAFCRIWACNK